MRDHILLAMSATCYGVRRLHTTHNVHKQQAASSHGWDPQQEVETQEIVTLVGPMRLKELLQIRNNRIGILVTVSGIYNHSKTGS